ncbi:hypothetical protein G9A89_008418 [Geosiphon pyriformis]|nr:hypothetical protein G9A89_008418 [Geosiphon pyriformis]
MPTLRLFLFKIKKSNKRNEVSALVVFHAKALFTRIPTPILVSILWIPMADAWKNNSTYPHISLHSMDTYGRCLERDSLANNRTSQCLLYSMLALFTRITPCYPTPIQYYKSNTCHSLVNHQKCLGNHAGLCPLTSKLSPPTPAKGMDNRLTIINSSPPNPEI